MPPEPEKEGVQTSSSFFAGGAGSEGGVFSGAAESESLLERFTRLSKGSGTPSPAKLPLELRKRDCEEVFTDTREAVGLVDTTVVLAVVGSLEVEVDC